MNTLIYAGIILLGIIVVGVVIARLYQRATKEQAFVRTGLGGQKVILNGGAIVMPIFHETLRVNLNTLKLTVSRKHEEAMISLDKLRVDATAEFYLRVKPDTDSVAMAAQTLGSRTMDPERLRDLIEGKLIDALRSVAAGMTMDDMHEKRSDFVQRVQETVAKDLETNGLELESVSLTGLDQTDLKYFNDSNAFDAVGRAKIVGIVEEKKFETNEIEANNRVKIAQTNREAKEQELRIGQEVEFAELAQQREIENQRAGQEADIAKRRAEARRESEEVRITTELDTQRKEIESKRDLEVSEQDRKIAVSKKSEEESAARAAADEARAKAITAEEGVKTAQQTAEAERAKSVALVAAQQNAEEDAIKVRVQAEAERDAAAARADAKRQEAQADADAEKQRAEGIKAVSLAEAEGIRAKNEAINLLGNEHLLSQERTILMDKLPAIIEAAGKPIEKIDGISIAEISGLGGNGGNGLIRDGVTTGGATGLGDELTSAALRYQTASPIVKGLLASVGIDGSSLGNMATSPFSVDVSKHIATPEGEVTVTCEAPEKDAKPEAVSVSSDRDPVYDENIGPRRKKD
tara:strand:+ start:6917 stop:8653 length:1737 start_codon:yes stop_codon:yes gene_type:complete